jgi:hypothetical protein
MNTTIIERRYVPAREIAAVCGIGMLDLETRYRPENWGSPRDFKWTGHHIVYAVESLPDLVKALESAGRPEHAECLRAFIKCCVESAALDEELVAPLKPVQHVEATPDEVNRAMAPHGHVSDRQPPGSWSHDWEERHE